MELHRRRARELRIRRRHDRVRADRHRLRLCGQARRQRRIRPHVKAQALLLCASVLPAEGHRADVTGHRHPRAHNARGLDRRRERAVGALRPSTRNRRANRHVAVTHAHRRRLPIRLGRDQGGHLALRGAHRKGRPVVHVQRRQTHARARRQPTHRHDRLLRQVLLVVAERRQRRRVLTHVKRRLHLLAGHDPSAHRPPRGRRRQGHAHRQRDHQGRGQQPPGAEHRLTGGTARRGRRSARPATASSIDGHVQPQRQALV